MAYKRADFSTLRDTGYGIGVHWTPATVPAKGNSLPYEEAVNAFDVKSFVEQVVEMGAGHVLFTSTHSKHHICAPNPEIDRILKGRTCKRDLLMEIADELLKANIKLIVYYNSGIHRGDPKWEEAVGANKENPTTFFDNWCRIISWMGKHYSDKIIAFWIDGGYELDAQGNTPWESMANAAKTGNLSRLVCFNSGIEKHHLYTQCQDYWAGEVCRLNYIPRGNLTPSGLPWYSFLSWHGDSRKPLCGHWVMNEENRSLDWQPPAPKSVVNFLHSFQRVGGTVTFNLFCYQDGTIFPPDFKIVKKVKDFNQVEARTTKSD